MKRVFPVASGGMHPGKVPESIRGYALDCIIQAGGGVHGHPGGTTAGAKAMIQAVEAWMAKTSLEEYAKDHHELGAALDLWGR